MAPITSLRLNTPAMSYKPMRFASANSPQDRIQDPKAAAGHDLAALEEAGPQAHRQGFIPLSPQSTIKSCVVAGLTLVSGPIQCDTLLTPEGERAYLDNLKNYGAVWPQLSRPQKVAFIDGVEQALDRDFGINMAVLPEWVTQTLAPVYKGSTDPRVINVALMLMGWALADQPKERPLRSISQVLGVANRYRVPQDLQKGIRLVRTMACLGKDLSPEARENIKNTYWQLLEEAVLKEPLAAYRQ